MGHLLWRFSCLGDTDYKSETTLVPLKKIKNDSSGFNAALKRHKEVALLAQLRMVFIQPPATSSTS